MAKYLVTGGTGLIGRALVDKLLAANQEVTVLTRSVRMAKKTLPDKVTLLESLNVLKSLDAFEAVINLCGEPIVDKRWTKAQKRVIQSSRWDVTQKLTNLFKSGKQPPKTFISGSAIGYYGRQGDQAITEDYSQVHDEFSHHLCKKWEDIALSATHLTRVCVLRTGIVLSDSGGALSKMTLPFKLGLGGPIGDGKHYMSWIHIDDMVNGILFLLNNPESSGIYNFTAPHPVTNKVFSKALAGAVNRPCILFTPKVALKIAMGEMADLLIYGQNVIPAHLSEDGFTFSYPHVQQALDTLEL